MFKCFHVSDYTTLFGTDTEEVGVCIGSDSCTCRVLNTSFLLLVINLDYFGIALVRAIALVFDQLRTLSDTLCVVAIFVEHVIVVAFIQTYSLCVRDISDVEKRGAGKYTNVILVVPAEIIALYHKGIKLDMHKHDTILT